jgi:choline dehydrogenase-like flavoprotein
VPAAQSQRPKVERYYALPILDFDELQNGAQLDADICIAGAGAAGITLALELLDSGHRILLVESGGEQHEPAVQGLHESECDDQLMKRSLHEGRARIFGGTTTLWAGQVMPLDESDFARREWLPASGWPFDFSTLAPYYRRADRILALEPISYDEDAWPTRSRRPPRLDPVKLRFRYSRFSPTPNLARAHRARLDNASALTVLLHASAVKLETTPDGSSIERMELRSLSGKCAFATARRYVLSCGAVETARLLLASGVGNDLVGRYFQEHVHVKLPVRPASRRKFQAMFNTRHVNGARYYPKIVASRELQQRHELLNVGGDVCYDLDPNSAVESAKLLLHALHRPELRREVPRAAASIATKPHQLFGAAFRRLVLKHKLSEGPGPISFCVQCEAPPDPDNRVSLDSETDALGMPRARVRWRISELERRSIELFSRTLADEFSAHGVGEIDLSSVSDYAAGFHHLGTTRMHDDRGLGVVDADCRLHDVQNLYVGSGSVFPAGGYSNPTLTIMALCVRLADHLKAELA